MANLHDDYNYYDLMFMMMMMGYIYLDYLSMQDNGSEWSFFIVMQSKSLFRVSLIKCLMLINLFTQKESLFLISTFKISR